MTRVAITVISFLKAESSCEVAMFPFLAPRPNRVVKWSWHVVARIGERKKHFVRYNQFRNNQWKPRRISTPWCALRARVTPPRSSAAGGAGPSRLFRKEACHGAQRIGHLCERCTSSRDLIQSSRLAAMLISKLLTQVPVHVEASS